MAMRFHKRGDRRPAPEAPIVEEEAARLSAAAVERVDRAVGSGWYEPGSDVDLAALTLCRLRRAWAGGRGGTEHGDEAVREALRAADPQALVWLASRAISHMDEGGFPEAVAAWYPQDLRSS
jgi:Arc/MetJ-type ribon-helix-helix transcriptional regulator